MEEHTDLRVIKTREAIEEAFLTLLSQKPFKQITVQNILDEARVNRKTFYRHYEDKYALADLLIEEQLALVAEALAKRLSCTETHENFPSVLRSFYQQMYQQRDRLIPLHDVVTERHNFEKELRQMFEDEYRQRAIGQLSTMEEAKADYLSIAYAAVASSTLRWFLQTNDPHSLDILEEIAKNRNEHPTLNFMADFL